MKIENPKVLCFISKIRAMLLIDCKQKGCKSIAKCATQGASRQFIKFYENSTDFKELREFLACMHRQTQGMLNDQGAKHQQTKL